MFCPKCGKENADGAGFCGSCGASLKKDVTATPVAASPTATAQKSAKKSGRLIGIVAAVVVVIVVIAGIATNGFGLLGVPVRDSVNDYSWEELSKISEEISEAPSPEGAIEVACKYNLTKPDGRLDGTQAKDVQLSNGMTTQVQIAGFAHDDKTSGGKAGITFIFKDAIADRPMNSTNTNVGGWENSQMRSWLATDGMNLLPSELRSKIVAVNKMSNNAGDSSSVASVTAPSDKLWLFSTKELCGHLLYYNNTDVHDAQGSEYKLFQDYVVRSRSDNSILVKTYNGRSCNWWERTLSGEHCFWAVHGAGNPDNRYDASHTHGVVPGFCI